MTDRIVDLLSPSFMMEWAERQRGEIQAISTPFPRLNAVCGDDGGGYGLAGEWFVTIGGGTNQGKSLIAQNMAVHAMRQGKQVGFISLEMTHTQLASRFYAMTTGTPVKSLERGRFQPEAFNHAWDGVWDLRGQPVTGSFLVNTAPLGNIEGVMDAAHAMKDDGVALLVVDYLQLVSIGDDDSIYRLVTEVAGRMRRFALEQSVTVLGLSQYTTPAGRETSKSPTMYDLMGGATLAQNSDIVLLLDHSRYERDALDRNIARTHLLIAKNRHGQTGEIPILWDYRTLTVREGLPDEENLWP